ncbi:MAG: sugar phosphate nucleotidyltransferase [Pseudomonadota bacterium]
MSSSLIGVIPAAGSGVRARPYSYEVHKGLFAIDGQPNILRLLNLMKNDLGIEEVVIPVGYMAESIRETFGDGSELGMRINYVENQHLDKGWAWSVLLAKPYLAGRHACVMLSDEFYLGTNHKDLAAGPYKDHMATVAVKRGCDEDMIKRNFSVERDGDRVIRLVENPRNVTNDLLGLGNIVVAPQVLELLEAAYDSGRSSIEFVNFIDELIRDGNSVSVFEMTGEYINLNDVASLEAANDIAIRARLTSE